MYTCVICDRTFTETDLEYATQIGGGRGSCRSRQPMTYVFADGFHYLRKLPKSKQQPQPQSVSEPKEDVALLLEANALAELPTPPTSPIPGPELKPELPKIDSEIKEGKPLTAIEIAFREFQENHK